MIFLISLVLALLVILPLRDKIIKYHNVIYVVTVFFAVTAVFASWNTKYLPPFVNSYVLPVLSRGGLAGALFVIVMVTGALPNGSRAMKKLMPLRGHLSIIASIFTIGHNVAYGRTYFVRLFTDASGMPVWQLAAAVCSLAMLLIMLPLFVTSFPVVRWRMPAVKWKKLQRLAYVFYGLMYCHVLLLNSSGCLKASAPAIFTVWIYTVVFGCYLVCRIMKSVFMVGNLQYRQCIAAAAWTVLATMICCVLFVIWPAGGVQASSDEDGDAVGKNYRDGIYTGSAMGMNGMINVSVRLEGGSIADIAIESHKDDADYFEDAVSVVDEIINGNSTDVDTISGATYSSGGIIAAVENALGKALAD